MTSTIKIGLSGTHCCGKTTLLEEFRKQYPSLPAIKEIAASFPKETRNDLQTQIKIMSKQIETELSLSESGFISDRTVIDNLAYCYYHYISNPDRISVAKYYSIAIKNAYLHLNNNPYTVIFFVNEYFPHDDSDHRDLVSDESQNLVQSFLQAQYEHLSDYTRIIPISGTTKERIATISNHLNSLSLS